MKHYVQIGSLQPASDAFRKRHLLGAVALNSITAWLDQLGLGQYAVTFEANALDFAAVAEISDADLQVLGVAVLDHRERLMEAIAALRGRGGKPPANALERRYLTIMFCDLADSTALSTRLDPEDMALVIGDFQRCCASAIARFDGFIARYVGDGMLAYFGYPRAKENCAERAIRAGLGVVQAIGEMKTVLGIQLKVRVGIATGLVVAGDLAGSKGERDAVVGETPNLAARLQNSASPNSVLISASTHRLAGNLFEYVELEPMTLKGFAAPVSAWRVTCERAFASRFEARREAGLTRYFGREAKLRTLMERWRSATTASGHVVLIRGEAGIGKSRIVEELSDRLCDEPHQRIDYIGSPFHENSPLNPVIAQLERSAGFAHDDPPSLKREKLDALLSTEQDASGTVAPILAALLSMPAAPRDPLPDPDAHRRKRLTFDTIINRIAGLTARTPMLLVCEDAHWFDPTTLELLDLLVERIASAMLLVVTCRPGFLPRWRDRHNVSELVLQRLDHGDASAIAEETAKGTRVLPPQLLRRIVEQTDGIPLFIEELTKAILESDLQDDTSESSLAIPDTLKDSLIARLDHVTPVKEVAQIGAAIGREFPQALLEAVASTESIELSQTLERLVDSDLLRRSASPSGTVYTFRHALVQDAAYDTLLHSRRREIHRKIAEALETRFREMVESQPEILAEHWQRAEMIEPAIKYWKLAGQRAAERSADLEADVHLRRALSLIEQLPEDLARKRLELDICVQHGGVLRVIRGPPAVETGKAFARARELCRETGDNTLLVPTLSGLYAYHFVRAENGPAAETAQELLAFAQSMQERSYLMIGHRTVGMVLVHTGNPAEGRKHLEQSLVLYDAVTDRALASLYGTDHAQTASGFLAKALWLLGLPDSAATRESWAVAHAKTVNHLFSMVQAAMFRITVRLFARDWKAAAILAQETRELASQHSLRFALNFTRFCLAACRCAERADPHAIDEMNTAARDWGPLNYRPMFLGLIAEAHGNAGNPAEGLRVLTEARSIVETTNERWIEPELCRLLGELTLMYDNSAVDEAEAAFREAIALAQRQAARSLELRASVSLARLWKRRGRISEAHALLAPVYDAFTEGFETPDLKAANSLLAEL